VVKPVVVKDIKHDVFIISYDGSIWMSVNEIIKCLQTGSSDKVFHVEVKLCIKRICKGLGHGEGVEI